MNIQTPLSFVLGVLAVSCAIAAPGPPEEEPLPFESSVHPAPAGPEGDGFVDVFVAVSNDHLNFVKKRQRYVARYRLDVEILDEEGKRVTGRTQEHMRTASGYRETNDAGIRQVSHVRFDLPPGRYVSVVLFRDADSQKEHRRKREFQIGRVEQGGIGVSSPVLLSDREEARRGDFDRFDSVIVGPQDDPEAPLVAVFRVVAAVEKEKLQGKAYLLHPTGEKRAETQFELPASTAWRFVEIPVKGVTPSAYDLVLAIEGAERVSRKVVLRAASASVFVQDLEEAIEQLVYVAKKEELDEMRKASGEEKRKLFEEFWKKRDPTPGTAANEMMDEYYRRVHAADEAYRCYKAGWKTDRGWVHIRFGPPDEVERHPFEIDSVPYEIWTYFNPERRFLFVDQNGFGDYELAESTGGNYRLGID